MTEAAQRPPEIDLDLTSVRVVFRYRPTSDSEHRVVIWGRMLEHPDYGEGLQVEIKACTYIFKNGELRWSDQSSPPVAGVYDAEDPASLEELRSFPVHLWSLHPKAEEFSYPEIIAVYEAAAMWDTYFTLTATLWGLPPLLSAEGH